MKMNEHWVTLENDERIYLVKPASAESVRTVLNADEDNADGRSNWVWVMLPNGDWVLGVFPQGDTYLETEKDRTG